MQIGQRVRKLQELRNLKQSHMAEKLGATQQTYSRYENGEIEITVNKLIEIAKVLDMKPEEVFMFDEKAMFNYNYWNVYEHGTGITTQNFNDELIKELKIQHRTQVETLKEEINRLHTLLEKSFNK